MMMMNRFCGMVQLSKAFSLIFSRDHCQRSSPSQISDTLRAGFEPAQKLSSGLVKWSCAVAIYGPSESKLTVTNRKSPYMHKASSLFPYLATNLFQITLTWWRRHVIILLGTTVKKVGPIITIKKPCSEKISYISVNETFFPQA